MCHAHVVLAGLSSQLRDHPELQGFSYLQLEKLFQTMSKKSDTPICFPGKPKFSPRARSDFASGAYSRTLGTTLDLRDTSAGPLLDESMDLTPDGA